MTSVYVSGCGMTPVGELWDESLYSLATKALHAAIKSAGDVPITAIVVGNMLSGALNSQENLAAVIASRAGLRGIECLKVEAGCASGAAAIRIAENLVRSGEHESVAVVGVEKMTDRPRPHVTEALSFAADFEAEGLHGITNVVGAALLTSLYLERYELQPKELAAFPLLAHRNASNNSCAMFRNVINADDWRRSPVVAPPLRRLDCAPVCDGAAALILSNSKSTGQYSNCLLGTSLANDEAVFAQRSNPLEFKAAKQSAVAALAKAETSVDDLNFVELHDAFPVVAAIGAESIGLAAPGHGWRVAADEQSSELRLQSGGGLKGRGHPVGATGVYQVVEAINAMSERRRSTPNATVARALTQSFGGLATNSVSIVIGEVKSD